MQNCRPRLLAATAAVTSAANAGEDEDEPHDVATAQSAHIAAATAAVEKHQEQNDVARVAAASVCTVCKDSVHVMYLLEDSDCSYITLRNLRKLCDRGIERILYKYIFVWIS